MEKANWVETAVLKFRGCCEQLHDELGKAPDGCLLDVADEQIFEKFQPLLREVQQQAIQRHIERKQKCADYRRCGRCKKKMRHKGSKSFEFITRVGNIKLCGTYYHCGCRSSKSVVDIVSDGRKFSHQACELTSRYAASNSYQQASRYLRKDFGIWVSHEMLRKRIWAVSGQIKDTRDNGQGEHCWEDLDGKRLYGYADGVLVKIRGEGWKECKLLRYECEGLERVRHRGVLGPIERFGRMVRRETIQIGAKRCDEIVLLMDGAEGFHRHLKKNLPAARQIVDYWHACQHIAEYAEQVYPDSKGRQSRWRGRYCRLLRREGAGELIRRLRRSRAALRDNDKVKAMDKLLGYLVSREDRMDYKRLLEHGYRIDSGPIESSCKNVVQGRMKGSGMRWSRAGASAMLEVRCALMSDLWLDVIQKCA
jgi:hypothetical protein